MISRGDSSIGSRRGGTESSTNSSDAGEDGGPEKNGAVSKKVTTNE